MKIEIDLRQLDKLQHDLHKAAEKALPHASRNAVNKAAFLARTQWIEEARGAMTLRGKFLPRSIQVDKARGTRFPIEAIVGSTAPHMGLLERGGQLRPKGSRLPIPTISTARAGAKENVIRRPNRLANIRLTDRPGGSRKQRNAVAIRRAIKTKSRFALIETQKGMGIARISGRGKQITVRLVWDLSRGSVQVPGRHTLERTLDKIEPKFMQLYGEALIEQLQRNHVLGY